MASVRACMRWLGMILLCCVFLRCCLAVTVNKATQENQNNGKIGSRTIVYPSDAGVIDVTRPPYNAVPDGVHDATDALQRAINDQAGSRHILYLPKGVYLVSRSLRLPPKNPQGNFLYGFTHIQGQHRYKTILRLKDATFTDTKQATAVLDSANHGSADWFSCSVQDLTIEAGKGNPGAIGLRFFSNNTGCVREVTIHSEDGQGLIGLDLAYNDMNGPLLVQRVSVSGFRTGIMTGNSVNSQTLQNVSLENQTECGLRNEGQCVSVENLQSANAVPAVRNVGGQMTLIGARLNGIGAAKQTAAIENRGDLFARNVLTPGYDSAVLALDNANKNVAQNRLMEYTSEPPLTLFGGVARSLNLPLLEVPAVPDNDPKTWRSPFDFGAERKEGADIAEGLQKAIDSGAETIYVPTGAWRIGHTVYFRNRLKRLVGLHSYIIPEKPLNGQEAPMFHLQEGSAPVLLIEQFDFGGGADKIYGIQNDTKRKVILRDMEIYGYRNSPVAGPLYIENVVGGPFEFTRQTVSAWQLNQETEGTHIVNRGGRLRILGLKTERGGTLIETNAQGETEVLGGLCYTTTAGKLAPMFVNIDSHASISLGERCYTGDPYTTIVREVYNGKEQTFLNTDTRYRGRLVLHVGKHDPALPQR